MQGMGSNPIPSIHLFYLKIPVQKKDKHITLDRSRLQGFSNN